MLVDVFCAVPSHMRAYPHSDHISIVQVLQHATLAEDRGQIQSTLRGTLEALSMTPAHSSVHVDAITASLHLLNAALDTHQLLFEPDGWLLQCVPLLCTRLSTLGDQSAQCRIQPILQLIFQRHALLLASVEQLASFACAHLQDGASQHQCIVDGIRACT